MKIIHIANLGQENYNGITEVVKNLSIAQMQLGHDVFVYHLFPRCVIPIESHIKVIDTYDEFKINISAFRPDIVIFHSIYKPQYFKFMKYCQKNHIPYLITFHGAANKVSLNKSKWKKRIANILFVNKFIEKSAGIIYLNDNEKLSDHQFSRLAPGYILSNGITLPKRMDYEPKVGNKIQFLFMGRYDYLHKGLDILISALDIAYRKIYDKAIFNFYGQGLFQQLKQDTAKFGDMISINGPVFGKDKEEVFRNSDIFLLPSRFEGMPIGVLEALSYGIPCVITKETNMAEVVDDSGLIVECNAESLAEAIISIVNMPIENLKSMSSRAFGYVRPFTWDNIAEQSIALYSYIINKNIPNKVGSK